MRAIFMTIIGASTILLGTLTLTDHSASAKPQKALACKPIPVEGKLLKASIQPNMVMAKNKANLIWGQQVKQIYGLSWAHYYYAKNKDYTCVPVQNDVACKLSARPCKLVTTIFPLQAYPPAVYPGLASRPSTRRNRPARLDHLRNRPARLDHLRNRPARLDHLRFRP